MDPNVTHSFSSIPAEILRAFIRASNHIVDFFDVDFQTGFSREFDLALFALVFLVVSLVFHFTLITNAQTLTNLIRIIARGGGLLAPRRSPR